MNVKEKYLKTSKEENVWKIQEDKENNTYMYVVFIICTTKTRGRKSQYNSKLNILDDANQFN